AASLSADCLAFASEVALVVPGGVVRGPPPGVWATGKDASVVAMEQGTMAAPPRFSFTLRKADDKDLGLHVTHAEWQLPLIVTSIVQGGAIETWNKLCVGRFAFRAVLAGDHIVSVNGISGVQSMVDEMRSKVLLRLEVMHPLEG
ncbi:unnamed protein product, partial [Polarella glacialis]